MSKVAIVAYQALGPGFFAYDPLIPEATQALIGLLQEKRPRLVVEHIGSTSIPGMPGKNSINVALIAPLWQFRELIVFLEKEGFTEHPFKQEPDSRPLRVAGLRYGEQTYGLHLHILEVGSKNHSQALFFRDSLRKHPPLAQEYARVKEKLVAAGASAEAYHQGKQAFIRQVLAQYFIK